MESNSLNYVAFKRIENINMKSVEIRAKIRQAMIVQRKRRERKAILHHKNCIIERSLLKYNSSPFAENPFAEKELIDSRIQVSRKLSQINHSITKPHKGAHRLAVISKQFFSKILKDLKPTERIRTLKKLNPARIMRSSSPNTRTHINPYSNLIK